MDTIEIKKITLIDIPELEAIGKQTFLETFADHNSATDMQQYLNNSFNTNQLKSELNNLHSEFYFALLNSKVIGYLKINFGQAQTELKDKKSLEIERIYVIKAFHGKKVGQVLYNKALHIAKQTKANYIWLGVWEKNMRAINFYKKNDFIAFNKHIFKLGNDEQTDIMMRLELNS